jgi:hypothetical protein
VIATISTIAPAFPRWRQPVSVTIRNRNGHLDSLASIVRRTSRL